MIQYDDCTKTKNNGKHEFWDVGACSSNIDKKRGNYQNMKQLNCLCFSHCDIYTMNSFHFTNTIWQERCDKKLDKMKKDYESKLDSCEKKLEEFKKKPKEPKKKSQKLISFLEYKNNIEKGNEEGPVSFGGASVKKSAKRHYRNVEYEKHGNGHHTIRRVHIVGGRGHKSVTTQMGKTRRTAKKALTKSEIEKICKREFVPGLFNDCMVKHAK